MKHYQGLIKYFLIFIFVGVSLSIQAGSKSDLAKEKRWETQIADSLLVGEAIKLKTKDAEFLALYAEPEGEKVKGAVIMIHGIGVHPAWPDVINPLRIQLPEMGWHTLSIQMPVLANEASDKDYVPLFQEVPSRIQAGVDFLKRKSIKNIVIAGHSLGATMASYYLATKHDAAVKTYVIISGGMGATNYEHTHIHGNLKKMPNINIVDIFGSEDHPRVMKYLKKRKSFFRKAQIKKYSTLRIQGANHFYRDKNDLLVEKLNIKLKKISHTD
ncbi:MAG: alpha/beta hydrolase family protein [Gammaproteobacteria bacterium]|nr:alpha/beta hydrolase family protein [Gammaproteobacteria bacterium]